QPFGLRQLSLLATVRCATQRNPIGFAPHTIEPSEERSATSNKPKVHQGEAHGPPAGEKSMSEQLGAGVDCSTQSTKVLVVDVSNGEVVATGKAAHAVDSSADGKSETHPDVWWDALREALAMTGRAADIDAISIGGQQHGLVLEDASGTVL